MPFARTLCIKRSEFFHEAEVRLLVQHLESTDSRDGVTVVVKSPDIGDILPVPFDYAKVLDDEVALDPRLDATEVEATKKELVDAGCTLQLTQSDLYRIDEMTIDLEWRSE